jgi:hypothetical protein
MVFTGLLHAVLVAPAQDLPRITTSAEVTDNVAEVPPALDDLARATSPSAAVEAYARARLAAPDNLMVEQVYVRRMVELGAPDMCAAQAQHVVSHEPDNGLAWAVLAFNAARDKDYAAALTCIAKAARCEPRDRFVQRTAGQLLAWYDTQADPARVSADLRDALRQIRRDLAGQSEYHAAYREARAFYEQNENAPGPTEVEPLPGPSETTVTPILVGPGYVDYGYDYLYRPYQRIYVDYSGPFGTYSWFPTGTCVILPRQRDHGRRYHRDIFDRTWFPRRYDVVRRDGHRTDLGPAPRSGSDGRVGPAHRGGLDAPMPRPHRADVPGAKNSPLPGLKPPATPGLKPPSAPGVKPASSPGVKAPAPPSRNPAPRAAASPQPHRVVQRAAPPPPRPAPTAGGRPNPRGR